MDEMEINKENEVEAFEDSGEEEGEPLEPENEDLDESAFEVGLEENMDGEEPPEDKEIDFDGDVSSGSEMETHEVTEADFERPVEIPELPQNETELLDESIFDVPSQENEKPDENSEEEVKESDFENNRFIYEDNHFEEKELDLDIFERDSEREETDQEEVAEEDTYIETESEVEEEKESDEEAESNETTEATAESSDEAGKEGSETEEELGEVEETDASGEAEKETLDVEEANDTEEELAELENVNIEETKEPTQEGVAEEESSVEAKPEVEEKENDKEIDSMEASEGTQEETETDETIQEIAEPSDEISKEGSETDEETAEVDDKESDVEIEEEPSVEEVIENQEEVDTEDTTKSGEPEVMEATEEPTQEAAEKEPQVEEENENEEHVETNEFSEETEENSEANETQGEAEEESDVTAKDSSETEAEERTLELEIDNPEETGEVAHIEATEGESFVETEPEVDENENDEEAESLENSEETQAENTKEEESEIESETKEGTPEDESEIETEKEPSDVENENPEETEKLTQEAVAEGDPSIKEESSVEEEHSVEDKNEEQVEKTEAPEETPKEIEAGDNPKTEDIMSEKQNDSELPLQMGELEIEDLTTDAEVAIIAGESIAAVQIMDKVDDEKTGETTYEEPDDKKIVTDSTDASKDSDTSTSIQRIENTPEKYENQTEKLEKILENFKQENWEKLDVEERKQAIEEFSKYQAEVLGLENPPKIVYYSSDDLREFGSFEAGSNEIRINENNIDISRNAIDTIAHEHRHAYQYEHALNPQNGQDLAFRENMEHYISPDVNYDRYREQLIERDAEEYAKLFTDCLNVNVSEELVRKINDSIVDNSKAIDNNLNLYKQEKENINVEFNKTIKEIDSTKVIKDTENANEEVAESNTGVDEVGQQMKGKDIFGPHYDEAKQLFKEDPEFFCDPDACTVVQGEEHKKARSEYNKLTSREKLKKGHHVQGLAFGGENVDNNIVHTGESTISRSKLTKAQQEEYANPQNGYTQKKDFKIAKITEDREGTIVSNGVKYKLGLNERHTRATNFQNKVLKWQRETGLRTDS